ncbi:MAG: Rpn family recombination-promoting nuclease/putative transposase [Lachnospiraceae bacterium]|nr:Rpn family recombination-promoting nuclease/putative transposase [Lachnospiraceae bacterium]
MADTKNLPKRSRYYQGMIDLNILNKGESYKDLKKSYIIFICKFDLFGADLCRYTFENVCLECVDIRLGDESTKIFINPYGKTENISEELKAFLKYLCEDNETNAFTRKLSVEVEKAKKQEEWRVEYMTLLMRDQENIEKGMERGIERGRALEIIEMGKEFGLSKETVIAKLQSKLNLSLDMAQEYFERFEK